MSGAGRKSSYRKGVTNQFLTELPVPNGTSEEIVKVTGTRGSNVFEIELSSGSIQLALLPNKFKKVIWIKRNEYIIVESDQSLEQPSLPIVPEDTVTVVSTTSDIPQPPLTPMEAVSSTGGHGIRYLIKNILNKGQIKFIQSQGLWPLRFELGNRNNNGEMPRGRGDDYGDVMPDYDEDAYDEHDGDEIDEREESNRVDSTTDAAVVDEVTRVDLLISEVEQLPLST